MTDYILLQINDSLFPIGGYSHSYGLETYIQKNILKNTEDIREYIDNKLRYSIAYTELLGARLAYENADAFEYIKRLDDIMTASKSPAEIRNASLKLGSRFIKTLTSCGISFKYNYFDKYIALPYKHKHHCTAYGVVCRAADIDERKALSVYLYAQTSAVITNMVKTVPLSQSIGQRLLYESFDLLDEIVYNVFELTEKELCSAAPAFDIRCMEHERLYSRLYMS